MVTRRRGSAPGKRTVKPKARSGHGSAPSLRFHYSDELHEKLLVVLETLEQSEDATAHRAALADVVVELTGTGLDFYFMKPLRRANPGFIVQRTAGLGLQGTLQMMGPVIRNIIGRMDGPQLLSVCGSIRQLMV